LKLNGSMMPLAICSVCQAPPSKTAWVTKEGSAPFRSVLKSR
jgi:hypothetical protein